MGVRYEKALARAVPAAKAGLWWDFEDSTGVHVCQTDLVLIGLDSALVLEAKYTYTWKAWEQLQQLYVPVLRLALGRPVFGVQVCKVLRPEWRGAVATELGDALDVAKSGRPVVLHWSGLGPLIGRSSAGGKPLIASVNARA